MRIAVIGAGISGNSAAWALSKNNEVTLYEKRLRPGGHSATVDIDYDGTPLSVDTGFIVYNTLNYPNFTAMLHHFGVKTEDSDMSFGFSADRGKMEWSGDSLFSVFAQKRNLVSPRFLMMLREIFRFNKQASRDLAAGNLHGLTLGQYLTKHAFSETFAERYLLAMGGAIWSTPREEMRDYPAVSFISFFNNHRLIHPQSERPIWRTISGGSRNYVTKLLEPLKDRVRLGAQVTSVVRTPSHVEVTDVSGNTDAFDQIILASHTDQSLAMLSDASDTERELLSAMRYRPNDVYLHRDEALMPKRKKVWSSWNFLADSRQGDRDITVSYWMNRLQNIDKSKPVFVTLNPAEPPRPDLTFARYTYDHPQFDAAALAAKKRLDEIQGVNRTWFCGAWAGHGFHEDGMASGLGVAKALGARLPWDSEIDGDPVLEAAE